MSEINIEQEYHEINSKRGWVSVYQSLGETAQRNEALDSGMSFKEAQKPANRKLNRYRDVNPYDHSRVVLSRGDTDYINANIVKHEEARRSYILTQGPLSNTSGHFWLMVWEQNSKAIIMLNKLMEKNVIKCHMYWPHKTGPENEQVMEEVGLKVEYVGHEDYSYFSKRVFKLTDLETKTSREVLQFHYTTWPDFGVPSSPTAFLEFLKRVRDSGALDDPECPAVIHCSAGIGRSGTFCLVDVCLVLIEQNDNNTNLSVQDILLSLRHYRTGLIQTADQLRFSYEAIIDGVRRMRGQDPESIYEEVPFTSDKQEGYTKEASESFIRESSQDDSEDDEPPPLPPPRGESLRESTAISAREIAERFITEAVFDSIKDATSNLISSENVNSKNKDFNRPLPAIPSSESMDDFMTDLRNSEMYTNNTNDQIITNNSVENKAISDNCPIGKPLPPLPRIPNSINEAAEQDNIPNGNANELILSKNEKEILNKNNSNKVILEDSSDKLIEAMDENCDQNLDKSPLSSPESESDRSNLRRRVRLEKQNVLAEKVRDMKRKQQESERRAQTKRFLLPIGLGLGSLCLLSGALYWYFRNV